MPPLPGPKDRSPCVHERWLSLLGIALLLLALAGCARADGGDATATAAPRPATVTATAGAALATGEPATAVPQGSATPVPMPTADFAPLLPPPPTRPGGDLTVESFAVVATRDVDGGKEVTLRWDSNGASARLVSGVRQTAPPHWRLPPGGRVTVTLDETLYPDPPFTLQVFDAADPSQAGAMTVATLPFDWPCAHDYFFAPAPALCPRGAPVETAAAEQPFTGGVMIWLDVRDAIYVFYPDGQWQRFADTWTEEEAESDPTLTPPPDRFQPIRGFGKVWREQPAVREQLGWATSPELGYVAQLQQPKAEADEAVTFVRTFNGTVYFLIERGEDSGEWGVAASG